MNKLQERADLLVNREVFCHVGSLTEAELLKQCLKLRKERPRLNRTELAIAIAGSHKNEMYAQIIPVINKLGNEGKL